MDEVIFAIGARRYSLRVIVAMARAWGDLDALEDAVREGLACLKDAASSGELPTGDEIEAAAAVRYDRELLTADEAKAWLTRWDLTVDGWTDHLYRSILRERWASDLPDILDRHPVTAEEIEAVRHAEGICSGDGFVLLVVRDKRMPSPDDAEIRRQAETSLLDRAIEHEVAQRVKWHHRLGV